MDIPNPQPQVETARARRQAELAALRNAQAACALDFLVYGDDEEHGRHADRCVFVAQGLDPCSRDYDPQPYVEAEPDANVYAGTGVGALYGLPGTEGFLWQLAGWNLTPRSTR